jgi:hypothetical protein
MEFSPFTLILLGAALAFIGLHVIWYIRPDKIEHFDDLQRRLTGGKPTIVEFYSNL